MGGEARGRRREKRVEGMGEEGGGKGRHGRMGETKGAMGQEKGVKDRDGGRKERRRDEKGGGERMRGQSTKIK